VKIRKSDGLDRLRKWLKRPGTCQLGIGAVSKNVVDAAIALAYETEAPLMLIASRRQVEARELGGGYVENWTTTDFANYVRTHDPQGLILLCRDHGGPWQNSRDYERCVSEEEAMESAIASFRADIEAGFDILHIDTGIHPKGEPPTEIALKRLIELYEACWAHAEKSCREIAFEVGTEDQRGGELDAPGFVSLLGDVKQALNKRGLPSPLFMVAQTGTKVVETRNIGTFDEPATREQVQRDILSMTGKARDLGVHIKAHNCDYLPTPTLRKLVGCGIGAANIAPEFGVVETRELLSLFEKRMPECRDKFVSLVLQSGKWKKWMAVGTKAGERERAEIAGHYVYATREFNQLKELIEKQVTNLDEQLRLKAKAAISRYLDAFGLTSEQQSAHRKAA